MVAAAKPRRAARGGRKIRGAAGAGKEASDGQRRAAQWNMLALGHELRAAARQLLRARRYSLAVVLTLAIGIGACGAIFTVVRGVLLRPLPYRQPGQLMLIKERIPPFSQQAWGGSAPDIGPLTRDQRVFSGVASFGGDAFDLSGGGGAPERVAGARVAWNLFPLLGVRPLLGRTFTRQEDIGAAPVALLSDGVAAPRQSARDCGWSSTWLTCSNSAERRGRAESAG